MEGESNSTPHGLLFLQALDYHEARNWLKHGSWHYYVYGSSLRPQYTDFKLCWPATLLNMYLTSRATLSLAQKSCTSPSVLVAGSKP